MNKLIITAVLLSTFTVSANDCKEIGVTAKSVMEWRQNREDIFEVLPKFPEHKEMVLDAYQSERIDTMSTLNDAVRNPYNSRYQLANDAANGFMEGEKVPYKVKAVSALLLLSSMVSAIISTIILIWVD